MGFFDDDLNKDMEDKYKEYKAIDVERYKALLDAVYLRLRGIESVSCSKSILEYTVLSVFAYESFMKATKENSSTAYTDFVLLCYFLDSLSTFINIATAENK